MNSTELTQAECGASYKALLIEARKLRGRSGLAAYRRAKLLCQVFEDRNFRADCGNLDDFRAAAVLDEYLEDLCVSFLDIRRMLRHFPKPKAWQEGRLSRLYNDMLKAESGEKDKPLSGKPRNVTAEVRKRLESQLTDARKELARQNAVRLSEIDQLRAKVADLERENAELRERITELEKQLT
ncbi:MAG TPA: hypothetical protein VLH60_06650 [Sedimentisphaerales bacterium]|nr:hypothetical protein [Sedimentisphaerales bacterium]